MRGERTPVEVNLTSIENKKKEESQYAIARHADSTNDEESAL